MSKYFIKSDVRKIIKFNKKKKVYKKIKKNIMGVHILPELPTNPHITIKNDFKRSLNDISNELLVKIKKILKPKKLNV